MPAKTPTVDEPSDLEPPGPGAARRSATDARNGPRWSTGVVDLTGRQSDQNEDHASAVFFGHDGPYGDDGFFDDDGYADDDPIDLLPGVDDDPPPRHSVRTQRGLLVAGSVCLFVLLAVLLVRPQPAGQDAAPAPDQPPVLPDVDRTENSISAKLLEPEPDASGASSKLPAETTTIPAAPEAEAAASPDPDPGSVAAQGAGGFQTGSATALDALPRSTGAVRDVANVGQWEAALAAAKPGDTIRLVANINQTLQYRGSRYRAENRNAPDGAASAPITITAAEGVWIDPGNKSNNKPALDILYTSNVNVIGVRVRNSQFGIRVLGSTGTAESPLVIARNTVTDIGHAGIHVGANVDARDPSRYVRVEGNTVTRTGQTAPQYGEGIYLGYGTEEWLDNTSNVQVFDNDISFVGAEGVDIKPGTRNILVEGNRIHDLSPISGGAISAAYVGTRSNPQMGENINVVLRRNRIWNVNLDGRGGSNDWAIWIGHGGVTVEGNAIWGLRGNAGQTRAIRVRALQDFGPHPIRIVDNIFWTATGWMTEGSPSAAHLIQASGNKGPSGASGTEVPFSPSGAPAIGSGGTADAGGGPGTALGF